MLEIIGLLAFAAISGTLWKTGVLRKVYDAIDVHGNKAADLLVSNIDLERLDIKRLAERVEKLGDLVDESEALLTGAQREQRRLDGVRSQRVEEMQDTSIALEGDPNKDAALRAAAILVGEAQDAAELQKEEVERIGISAANSREAWDESLKVLRRRKAELGHAEAEAVEAKAKRIEGRILQENKELTDDSGQKSAHVLAIEGELDKANAKVARFTPNPTQKKVAKFREEQRADAILQLYGLKPGATPQALPQPSEHLSLPDPRREGAAVPVRRKTED